MKVDKFIVWIFFENGFNYFAAYIFLYFNSLILKGNLCGVFFIRLYNFVLEVKVGPVKIILRDKKTKSTISKRRLSSRRRELLQYRLNGCQVRLLLLR